MVSTSKAAQSLGVSKKTLLKWCGENRIQYVRYPSGHLRFQQSVLDNFVGKHTVPAAGGKAAV